MKIEEIDKNFKVESALGRNDIVFTDVKNEPFRVYGLYDYKNQPRYIRTPEVVAAATNDGVKYLTYNTAGGRIRFATNSPYIAVRCKMKGVCLMPHMALSGSSGFDVYRHCDGKDTYHISLIPPTDMKDGYSSLYHAFGREWRENFDGYAEMTQYTVHFPLYNDVESVEIGLKEGSVIEKGAEYRDIPPFVLYGSSITQGGCVSRPGNAYGNVISAKLNIDHINLGFSGNARGEDAMAEYIASLKMSVFVYDYDHNAPNPEHLRNTHKRFFEIIRKAQPNLPVIMVTRPDALVEPDAVERRNIVYNTYYDAYSHGDKNVSFIDGYSLFVGEIHDLCTVDGCHPNDAGHIYMGLGIGREIDRILKGNRW